MKLHVRLISSVLFTLLVTGAVQAGPLARIYIDPGNMILCSGIKQQFSVYGTDSENNIVPVTDPVTWTRNSTAGTITSDGLFTAGSTAGLYREAVKAQVDNLKAVAIVQVVPATVQGGYVLARAWKSYNPGRMISPDVCAIDSSNNVYVKDASTGTIQKFDSSGQYISTFGLTMDGESFIRDVHVRGNYIYVAWDSSVCKLDTSDNVVLQFGSFGNGSDQFMGITGIEIDASGNIYVLDPYINPCIRKYNSSGHEVCEFGAQGTGNGQIDGYAPVIALDSHANIYVVDSGRTRIQKFSSSGAYLTGWNIDPESSGMFVDSEDHICVPIAMEKTLAKYDSDGHLIATITYPDVYSLVAPRDSLGNMYILQYRSITKCDSAGSFLFTFGHPANDALLSPENIVVDSENKIFVSHCPNGSNYPGTAVCFDANGGLLGSNPALTGSHLAIDQNGIVRSFDQPSAITKEGNIYSVDTYGCRITGRDSRGNVIAQWGSQGSGDGQLYHPDGIAVDGTGRIYVADSYNCRIQVFDGYGNFLTKWENDIWYPRNLTILSNGLVCIGEDECIQVRDLQGKLITKWGSFGHDYNQVVAPCTSMADDGTIYALETTNQRVDQFVKVQASCSELKAAKDGTTIVVSGLISTAATTEMGDCCYAEAADRSSGIKITGKSCTRSKNVVAVGVLATVDGERELQATSLSVTAATIPQPLALTNKSLGGGDFNFNLDTGVGQRGVEDGVGLSNIGLLVKTTGKVTVVGDEFFYIDDGTHAKDASIFNGVRVKCGRMSKPAVGTQVSVTGISSITKIGDRYFRSIRPRASTDIASL